MSKVRNNSVEDLRPSLVSERLTSFKFKDSMSEPTETRNSLRYSCRAGSVFQYPSPDLYTHFSAKMSGRLHFLGSGVHRMFVARHLLASGHLCRFYRRLKVPEENQVEEIRLTAPPNRSTVLVLFGTSPGNISLSRHTGCPPRLYGLFLPRPRPCLDSSWQLFTSQGQPPLLSVFENIDPRGHSSSTWQC